MICPNCKTELVEVNGRYICSDCGREIPENEVMASDWGNGGTVRAGLYGAGTDEPEDGSKPVAEYNTSLSESESEDIATPQVAPEPSASEIHESPEELTVEEVLQQQSTGSTSVDQPASEPVPDTGFYAAESSIPVDQAASALAESPEEPVAPVAPVQIDNVVAPETTPVEPVMTEPVPVESVAQEIPITVPPVSPEMSTESVPTPDIPVEAGIQAPVELPVVAPEHSEVVKDMFAESEAVAANTNPDPGIYTDPIYDTNSSGEQPTEASAVSSVPMTADKRLNLIIIIAGVTATFLLIAGGVLGYVALSQKAKVEPTVTNQEVTWQELQVVDGGFKISFPGTPEKSEATQAINGIDMALTNYAYTTDDITYSVGFAKLDAAKAKVISDSPTTTLPGLVGEIATARKLNVGETKIGKYYKADAIDFTLTGDAASYQGKLIISSDKYILAVAGSDSGQTVEYSKFIKSFVFISGSTQ